MKPIYLKPSIFMLFVSMLFVLAACTTDEPNQVEIRLNDTGTMLDSMQILVRVPGARLDQPSDPVKEGYDFTGWFSDEARTIPYTFSTVPDESIDLYAGWAVRYYDINFQLIGQIEIDHIMMTDTMMFMAIDNELWCWGASANQEAHGGGGGKITIEGPFDRCTVKSADGQDTLWPSSWDTDIKVSTTGNNHVLILDEAGKVYAWGLNEYGQLGTSNQEDTDAFIEITESFQLNEADPLISIVTSETNSYALSSRGRIFGWGLGIGLPIDIPDDAVVDHPIEITEAFVLSAGERVHDIVAADSRAYALSNQGNLYGWGLNDRGQLGFTSDRQTRRVFNLTRHFVSGDESIFYIDAKNDGFFLLKDTGDACMITGGIADSHDQVTCTVTPFDGSDVASMFGGPNPTDIRNRTIAFNGTGVLMKTTTTDPDTEIEVFSWSWGVIPEGFSSDQAVAYDAFLKLGGPDIESRSIMMTDDAVCMLNEDSELFCWGNNAMRENRMTITYFADDDRIIDYLDDDDDNDGIPTTFETPNIFTFEMQLELTYQVPYGMNVLEDTSWFENIDAFVSKGVFSRAQFDDFALSCEGYDDCPRGMPAENVVMRYLVDVPRFKAGALIVRSVN